MIKCPTAMLVLLFIIGPASSLSLADQKSDDAEEGESNNRAGLSDSDRRFVVEATHSAATETELARLALSRISSDEARIFARRLIDDLSKTMSELEQLAADKGLIALSVGSNSQTEGAQVMKLAATDRVLKEASAKRKAFERLSRHSGAKFDIEYLRLMKKNHEKVIEMFRRTAIEGHDLDLMIWAGKKMSLLGDHIQMAGSVLEKIKRAKSN